MEPTDNDTNASGSGYSNSKHKRSVQFSAGETAQIGTCILLLLFALKYAAAILIPLTLAIMLSLLFIPIVNFLSGLHIPKRIGAAFVVAGIVTVIIGGIIILSAPAEEWLEKSPQILQKLDEKMQLIKRPLKRVQEAAEKVEGLAEMDEDPGRLVVKPEPEKLFKTLFSATPEFFAFLVLSIVLLYFMLFSGETPAEYALNIIYRITNQPVRVETGHSIQQEISRYLLTISIINACLGFAVTVVLAVIGLPNPILWGTMAGLLNFAPYIGAICSAVIIAIVSFLTFDSLFQILLAPALFLIITSLEGQFITPQILGSRFSMNPLLIFLSIILWGWLWGYVGALLAFPLLVSAKILSQSMDAFKPLAKEERGEAIEERTETTGEAVDETTQKTGDAMEKTGDAPADSGKTTD
jgi:predicted PurR-regulated permease PerM